MKTEKIISLGDIHGRTIWKDIVNKHIDANKIVFIGDYFDSFDISGDKQIENFNEILEFKKANMNKVVLLVGNHDFHYMDACEGKYSGYQSGFQYQISAILKENIKLLQMAYVNGNNLFTHAGVSKTWCEDNAIDMEYLEQSINDNFAYQPSRFNFDGYNDFGDDVTQSPIWIRPKSLLSDKIDGYNQIVGHTGVSELDIENKYGLILTDCLGTTGEYLIVTTLNERGEYKVGRI